LKVAKEDKTLPICWKGAKPFKSVLEVKNFFKTITINFTNGRRNTQLYLAPELYLIVSVRISTHPKSHSSLSKKYSSEIFIVLFRKLETYAWDY